MTGELMMEERNELLQHEQVIEHGLKTFVDVGNALLAIRDKKLYRQDFGTFEDYCRERWNLKQSRAYQLMDAAEAVQNIKSSTNVELPATESQARPLTKLSPDIQPFAWQYATETAPNGKVTAAHVEQSARIVSDAIDTISKALGDEARTAVLSGNSKVTKQDVTDAAEWYKSNPGERPTINQEAEELAGEPDAYTWTEDNIAEDKKPMITIPTTEEEILAAARRIQKEKEASKKELIEQKKQEAMAVERATIEVAPMVYQSDCVEFLENYPDNHFDMLFTDPPYATDVDDIDAFVNRWVPVALRKVKPTGRAYICTGAYPEEMQAYLGVLLSQDKFIVDAPLVWTYRNTLGVTPKMKYNLNYQLVWHLYSDDSHELDTSITNEIFSVQDINAPDGRLFNRFHTWQKPDELARRLITHATQPGDLIADPFVCTGTFVLMASKLNRCAVGADISADNLSIAKERGCNVIR